MTNKSKAKKKEINSVVVPYNAFIDLEFKPPARCKWFIKMATGDFLFIQLSKDKRREAQAYVDKNYGRGKYVVRPV
jgi:hypothetical protein